MGDLGLCPKNPRPFEKGRSKLLVILSVKNLCQQSEVLQVNVTPF
jgi:hypothetical protein